MVQDEPRVAQRLEKYLARSEVLLLHDRRIPRTSASIDHVAMGPGGVTVIDTKNISGKVELLGPRNETLHIDGRDRTTLVERLAWQVQVVRDTLDDLGFAAIPVAGALCFANGAGLPFFRRLETQGMLIDAPRRVAALARRPGPLGAAAIAQLREELASALSPA